MIDLSLGLGYNKDVFDNLLQIVRCDSGLGTIEPNPNVLQVTFQQTKTGVASSDRILALVNAAPYVLITGVDSSFVIPYDIQPISAHVGGVTVAGTLTTPIYVWVDLTDANGQYYSVFDADRQTIYFPPAVLLYHELAHAYHWVEGDAEATDGGRQAQAIKDENAFRSQLGLLLRHPTADYGQVGAPSHGGVTFPKCEDPHQNFGCIAIATSALALPHALSLSDLRATRLRYRQFGGWVGQAVDSMLAQYRRFSPSVVAEMAARPAFGDAVAVYVVQPFVHFLKLIEQCLGPDADPASMLANVNSSLDAYLDELREAGKADSLEAAAAAAAGAGSWLAAKDPATREETRDESDSEFPYHTLAAAISSAGGDTAGYAWAFEGLSIFLRQAAERRTPDEDALTQGSVTSWDEWFARTPIPWDPELETAGTIRSELDFLRERLFTRTRTRRLFARQLLSRWPLEARPRWEEALRDAGYTAAAPKVRG